MSPLTNLEAPETEKLLVPWKKALCVGCREVTVHVHVGGRWHCNICDRDSDSSELPLVNPISMELFIRAMGSRLGLGWRIIATLSKTGQAWTYDIADAAGISRSGVKLVLERLYEANLVLCFKRRGRSWGRVWSLNRANPILLKILAVLEACE